MNFPGGRRFAFTVLDDTDMATVGNVSPVYEVLASCGLRTTKTVWSLAPTQPYPIGGSTLADPEYLDFVRRLKEKGFEIASHGATSHGVTTDQTARALETFKELIGYYPTVHCNHSTNRDNLYWGAARFRSRLHRAAYAVLTAGQERRFEGHRPESPYFWGDLCRTHIRYVRNFVFRDINLLNIFPRIPYHDAAKPYVNYWFTSTQAPDVGAFLRALAPENQERLEREGGVCILYTHFGAGFVRAGALDPEFRRLVERLSLRDGWFVPVTELLDHLRTQGGGGEIAPRDLAAMERRWIRGRLFRRKPRISAPPASDLSMRAQ